VSAIPLAYNLASLRARWASAVVAVLGIAGTVAVFVAVLALARGFRMALVGSGSPRNALVMRAGSSSEMYSVILHEQVNLVEDSPGVAKDSGVPLASPEVVVVAVLPLRATGTDANVQARGVTPMAFRVHDGVRLVGGRVFKPGLPELVAGRNAVSTYQGVDLGGTLRFGGMRWTVVGVLDSGGSAFDSELWCDADVLNQAYQRPKGLAQSIVVRLDPAASQAGFRQQLAGDPRLAVQTEAEIDYYEKQSRALTALITGLGSLVALVMAMGAVFAALNTMYSAVAERSREIATLRALGFGAGAVVLSFVLESLLIAALGGVLGCLAVLPVNGLTTGTLNWQTFSHLAFAFRVTPVLLASGFAFALGMGLAGGVPPALHAARAPVAAALRDL
jgi:putative ABC transport system permease protein